MIQVEATVDRIEGPVAVLEVGDTTVDWPLAALPAGIREGDRVSFTVARSDGVSLADAEARLKRLESRGPAGDDIDL